MDHTYQNVKVELVSPNQSMSYEEGNVMMVEEGIDEQMDHRPQMENEEDNEDTTEETFETLASMSGDNTSKDFYMKLIQLVRCHPNLYDKFDPVFRCPLDRERSWVEIAKAMNTSVSFAQNRWIRLRERFAKERKALAKMRKSGNIDARKRLWPYFLPMLFLSSHIRARRTPGSAEEAGDVSMSQFLSEMADTLEKRKDESSSEATNNEVEIVDESFTPSSDFSKKRKHNSEEESPSMLLQNLPRRILAKRDGTFTTVYLRPPFPNSKETDNKNIQKLPAGAVLLKPNVPASLVGSSQVVLVPTTATPSTAGKSGVTSIPTGIVFQPAPQSVTPVNDMPTPNSAEHHFGMLVARELERFPPDIRNRKKQRILMVLYE